MEKKKNSSRKTTRASASVKGSSKGKTTPRATQRGQASHRAGIKGEIISIFLLMLAVFTYIVVTRFRGVGPDFPFIGLLGGYYLQGLEALFGLGALLVPFYLLFWSIHIGITHQYWSLRMWGASLLAGSVLLAISVYNIPVGLSPWEAGANGLGGGYLGGALAYVITQLLGRIGFLILLIFGMVASAVMLVNKPLLEIIGAIGIGSRKIAGKMAAFLLEEVEEVEEATPEKKEPSRRQEPVIIQPTDSRHMVYEQVEEKPEAKVDIIEPPAVKEEKAGEEANRYSLRLVRNQAAGEQVIYQKPPLELLANVSGERSIDKKYIKESITVLEDTFASFGISVKVNQVSCGPAVTRYELSPAPGVKVSRIISLTDDLQLNLAAPGIRMEAPIPGKSAVGIEIPNNKILRVGLRNLLSSPVFDSMGTPLAFALGEDITGNAVVARLNDMPHLLIAGSTGSGKSVCLNCIIMSLLYNSTPDELRLVFIDPKMVELTVYNGIPHLLTPVVTDPKKAAAVLRWMVNEMEKRYRLFAEKGVRDIQRYNQSSQDKLPYIVIIIDELADLMMVSPVDVEDAICRLAQMARAAGMHLIVATQRPSVDVVTGVIKANIPSRIAFAVSSQADSRTILDCAGAEKLLGKGDMLFFPVGAAKPYRIQGAFVSDQDIEKTVHFIKEQVDNEEVADNKELEITLQEMENDAGDELFWEAVDLFVESQKASVSLLQRRLRIGYARAARLVDLMEDRGIVSELDNNKRREVLIDRNQLEKLYERNREIN